MKKIYKLFFLTVLFIVLCPVSSCKSSVIEDASVKSVILSSSRLTRVKGQTSRLTVKILPEDAHVIQSEWTADNSNVKIDQEGNLTALEVGSSVVTFTADGISASCHIEIVPDEIPVEKVEIVPSSMTVNYQKYAQLDYGLTPKNATDERVTWTSEDESVVTVDQTGRIQGIALGSTYVTVTATNGKTAKCNVTVVGKRVEELVLYYTGQELNVGEMECQYIKSILPSDVSDKTINWTSQDEDVVTVEWSDEMQYAILKGVGEGFANVLASPVTNPDIVEYTWVTVAPKTDVPYRIGRDWVLVIVSSFQMNRRL